MTKLSFISGETFRKVTEIPKGARKKIRQKSAPFGIEHHLSEFPSPFDWCCEVPENFSAGRLNRGKYECTEEAVFVCAAAPARFI